MTSNQSEPVRTNTLPVCPACQSPAVTTAAKHPDANSYWRCETCGEMWNIGRRGDELNRGRRRW